MTLFPTVFLPESVLARAPRVRDHLAAHGLRVVDSPAAADVLVAIGDQDGDGDASSSRQDGAGVVVLLGARPVATDLLAARGITRRADASNGFTVEPGPVRCTIVPADPGGSAPTEDLLAWTTSASLTVVADLAVRHPAIAALRQAGRAGQPGPVVAALADDAGCRVVAFGIDVLADETDDDGEASRAGAELLLNAVFWAAPRPAAAPAANAATETGALVAAPAWLRLKEAVTALQPLQVQDGSVPDPRHHAHTRELVDTICAATVELAPRLPHDADYLTALVKDFGRWCDLGLGVPDFLDSLSAFHPERDRTDGLDHLVVFPMYTQNGSTDRKVEAVLLRVFWPQFVADLEAGGYSNAMFVPITFLDFTAGYDTNSAVLFPETVAMREIPRFTWGGIFADREAARFRRVVRAAADTTRLALPPDAARLLDDQRLAQETFVMWDLIHDRTHMRGDLPFDPFMIKQRMPYFLYSLEELRCDLTAFREAVKLEADGVPHARLVQYAVIFDRIFRFAVSGSRVRNYDGLGGQLLFAWLHQHHVLHWTDSRLTIDWPDVPAAVIALGDEIDTLYWRSIDRPKVAHWLAAYALVAGTLTPHPASAWARAGEALPLDGPPKGLTDAVLPDEFPLSMFYEALARKIGDVVASTSGITA